MNELESRLLTFVIAFTLSRNNNIVGLDWITLLLIVPLIAFPIFLSGSGAITTDNVRTPT